MSISCWIELLKRQTPGPIGFDEIVVGYDFDLLSPQEIQAWVSLQTTNGPQCRQLVNMDETRMEWFEGSLWAACAEATGKTPRPGGKRWSAAQDRWRVALLKDALEASLNSEALAIVVENIYEKVGCPEDMLGLWSRPAPWQKAPGVAHRDAIEAFLKKIDFSWSPLMPTAA